MTRQKKVIRVLTGILAVIVIGCFSVYLKPLDKMKEEQKLNEFRPTEYARYYWDKVLTVKAGEAVNVIKLTDLIAESPEAAFKKYGRKPGISERSNFLMRGHGQITTITDDYAELKICNSEKRIRLITGLVFGNVLRDCTGSIRIDDFKNSMDFNNISLEINRIVNNEVIPDFKSKAALNDFVYFGGAAALSRDMKESEIFDIIPVRLKIINDCKEK